LRRGRFAPLLVDHYLVVNSPGFYGGGRNFGWRTEIV
jgi:hypothetical protein